MNQRSRKSSQYNDTPSGGNVLFTLGLISVVALLIVGYIMTQGGVKSIAENGLAKISLVPSPTPPAAEPTTASGGFDEIVRKYEKEMLLQKESYETQIKQLRDDYETRITDLNTRIQLLEISNKTLREKSK